MHRCIIPSLASNQFAVGLRQDIKVKVAGVEGTFEQSLTKAKFEEAKLRDIGTSSSIVLPTKRQPSLPRNKRTVQGFNTINQKRCYNCNATGERVFVYMPAAGQGEAYKLAKKFQGPFHILAIYGNGLELANINRPGSKHIRVALHHVRRCIEEINDITKETRDNGYSEKDVNEESGLQVDVLYPGRAA